MIAITETVKADFSPQPRGVDGNVEIYATIGELRDMLAKVEAFGSLGQVVFHVGATEDGFDTLTIELRNGEGPTALKPKPTTRRKPTA